MEIFEHPHPMIPGFFTPDHPKADNRLFALPEGGVNVTVVDRLPLGSPLPPYEFYLSTENGRKIILHLTAGAGQVVIIPNGDQTERHVLRFGPPAVTIYPGTYQLRGMVNGQEMFSKSLTVSNHPALP